MYVVTEDFEPSSADAEISLLSVKAGQRVEVLDDSEKGAWLVLTLPQDPGEQQAEGFLNPRLLRRATPPGDHAHSAAADRISSKSEKFEAETGQELPKQRRGSGDDDVDAPGSASSHTHSLGSEGESTGQNRTGQSLSVQSADDLNATTPSQTSFLTDSGGNPLDTPLNDADDVTVKENEEEDVASQPHPPPHADLLADDDVVSGRLASFSISSMEQSSSPPPLPPEGAAEEGKPPVGSLPHSMSLQSLPTSFSPATTPAMAPHKFLGYNPMMVCTWTCMCLHVHASMHVCTCMCIILNMYVSACTCMYVCITMYVCTCMCIEHVCVCMYMHVCITMYVCTCMCMCMCLHAACMYVHACPCSDLIQLFSDSHFDDVPAEHS